MNASLALISTNRLAEPGAKILLLLQLQHELQWARIRSLVTPVANAHTHTHREFGRKNMWGDKVLAAATANHSRSLLPAGYRGCASYSLGEAVRGTTRTSVAKADARYTVVGLAASRHDGHSS